MPNKQQNREPEHTQDEIAKQVEKDRQTAFWTTKCARLQTAMETFKAEHPAWFVGPMTRREYSDLVREIKRLTKIINKTAQHQYSKATAFAQTKMQTELDYLPDGDHFLNFAYLRARIYKILTIPPSDTHRNVPSRPYISGDDLQAFLSTRRALGIPTALYPDIIRIMIDSNPQRIREQEKIFFTITTNDDLANRFLSLKAGNFRLKRNAQQDFITTEELAAVKRNLGPYYLPVFTSWAIRHLHAGDAKNTEALKRLARAISRQSIKRCNQGIDSRARAIVSEYVIQHTTRSNFGAEAAAGAARTTSAVRIATPPREAAAGAGAADAAQTTSAMRIAAPPREAAAGAGAADAAQTTSAMRIATPPRAAAAAAATYPKRSNQCTRQQLKKTILKLKEITISPLSNQEKYPLTKKAEQLTHQINLVLMLTTAVSPKNRQAILNATKAIEEAQDALALLQTFLRLGYDANTQYKTPQQGAERTGNASIKKTRLTATKGIADAATSLANLSRLTSPSA
jgi:hypothetical protein